MKYSRLGPFACQWSVDRTTVSLSIASLSIVVMLLFTSLSWAQKGESYGDMATPQVRSDKLATAGALAELRCRWKAEAQPAGRGRPHARKQQLRPGPGNAG